MEQQWSRHSRLTPLKARACGDKKRRPIFAVVDYLAVSGLCGTLCSSVSVLTTTQAADGLDPTITAFIRSQIDDTRDSKLHIRA